MDSVAGGASEGAAAAAAAGSHIGHQLYTSGVSAMTEAASVAQEAGTELGSGDFGQALKRAWRPPEYLRESFENIHQFHQGLAQTLSDAVDTSYDHYRPRFAGALAGAAGDALLAAHDATCRTWSDHQDKHTSAATAAAQAVGHIKGLQGRIDNLAEAGEQEFNTAIRDRDPVAAMDVWTRYNGLAETSTSEATYKATTAIQAANFTIPLDAPKTPPAKDGQQTDSGKDGKHPADGDPKADGKPTDGDKPGSASPDGSQTGTAPATQPAATPPGGTPDAAQSDIKPAAPQGDGMQTPVTQGAPTMLSQLPQAMSGAAGGGQGGGSGGGGGGSGMSGLGSAFKPPSSMGSSSMPTSPASSMPSAPSMPSSSSAASPMSNPGSSFQSGLASGMSATGGGNSLSNMASPVSQQSVTQQGLPVHQVGGAPAFGSGPAGVPLSAPGGDAGVGGSAGGSSSGGGAPAGGGAPMMPPAAMGGAAPMAPYSAPGAGAGGATGGGGAGTAPAAASGQSASAGSGVSTPGPVVAGGAGSTVSAPGVAAMANEVNPDMLLAQRVLGGLVRGCEDWPAPMAWAVGVVKTPVGSQVVIASSLGGGSYVPSTVFLPATARLAVVDPALPFGWAHGWMGCLKPSKILMDHFEHFSKRVAGATISAMVTTELWPQEPAGVNDFLAVQYRDALRMVSVAPTLDGAHQHRLTALDPVLAQRVSSLAGKRADVSAYAAAQLTAAVIRAAAQQDGTGHPLATEDEGNILASVQRGTADSGSWKLYDELAYRRYGR